MKFQIVRNYGACSNQISVNRLIFFAVISLLFILSGCKNKEASTVKPNIILILVDDLGYGDLGCYGSKSNLTPNIDQLAREGMKLTDFHSNGPMCTPTRASLLTGMYQNRLGEKFEGPLSGKTQYDEGLPLEVVTIAELFQRNGYATGMFGKWHLGYKPPYLPTNQGFDEFRGLAAGDGDHHSHIDRWGREDWWKNDSLEIEPGYSVDLITKYSIDFMERNKNTPFLLYVPHLAIHFPWQGPDDPAQRQKGISYENDKWGIIPDKENVHPHVKAMVERVDWSLGEIMKTLKRLHLDENTLVIFTSDNGGYIHYDHQFLNISSNGKLRGQKAEVYEGGHRVPFIAWWPGKIPAGMQSDQTVMTMDLFPTFAELANIQPTTIQPMDGISLTGLLLKAETLPERTLFWKMDDEIAIRKGSWKLIKISEHPPELYNLDNDISETVNLSGSEPDILNNLWYEFSIWSKEMNEFSQKWK
jgi:arylsulfatase A-like enzyme